MSSAPLTGGSVTESSPLAPTVCVAWSGESTSTSTVPLGSAVIMTLAPSDVLLSSVMLVLKTTSA